MTNPESDTPADQILEKIFAVILEEARLRPDFAERLIAALPTAAIARIEKPKRDRKPKPGIDPNSFSLVAIMQTEGEAAVRRRLNPLQRKQDVRAIAEAQHIPVDHARFYASRTRLEALKDELLKGARARIADRMAAAG